MTPPPWFVPAVIGAFVLFGGIAAFIGWWSWRRGPEDIIG